MKAKSSQASGKLRKGSDFGKGQLVAADYSLSPSITFSNQNADGYSSTAEDKVVVAAFTDSYNNIVRATCSYRAQHVEGGLGTGGKLGVQGAK